jgi:hypothetical protein
MGESHFTDAKPGLLEISNFHSIHVPIAPAIASQIPRDTENMNAPIINPRPGRIKSIDKISRLREEIRPYL